MMKFSRTMMWSVVLLTAGLVMLAGQRTLAQCQRDKLTPAPSGDLSPAGGSVDISGDYLVVGVSFADTAGVNSGVALVYQRVGSTWVQQASLLGNDTNASDQFGDDVAIDGDRIVVTAPFADAGFPDTGVVYVFRRIGTNWVQEGKLIAGLPSGNRFAGGRVDISGDDVVFTVGVNSPPAVAYVFHWNGTSWGPQGELSAADSDGVADAGFGKSASISGDDVVIGAADAQVPAGRVGAAYVFHRTAATWSQQAKLIPSDGVIGGEFGIGVAVNGSWIAVGNDLDDELAVSAGAVYLYQRVGNTWIQDQKLHASDSQAGTDMGFSVDLDGSTLVAGAPIGGNAAGAVYGFSFNGSTWQEFTKFTANDGQQFELLGFSAAVSGDTVLGLKLYDSSGMAAVYVFDTGPGCVPEQPEACCFAPSGCTDLVPSACATQGGTSLGTGTTCATSNCVVTGACCLTNGSCLDNVDGASCLASGGTFAGIGTACAGVVCPQASGACCSLSGGCVELPRTECVAVSGNGWAGSVTTCSDTFPAEAVGPRCSDGLDNDCDGTTDCQDSDCDMDPICLGPGLIPPDVATAYPNAVSKNRYITFVPSNGANYVAYKITHVNTGVAWYISPPRTSPATLSGKGITQLVSDPTPVLRNWSGEALIHVTGCMIAPGNTYEVRATANGVTFSAPLTVSTTALPTDGRFWADAVGPFVVGGSAATAPSTPLNSWSPPDGIVSGFDVTAAIKSFQGINGADITWIDWHPEIPDGIINGNDVLRAVNAFSLGSGMEFYPFSVPDAPGPQGQGPCSAPPLSSDLNP